MVFDVWETPPSTAAKNGVFTEFFVRSEVAVLRQSNSHRRTGTQRSLRSGEKYCERVTAGKQFNAALGEP
jgi:hypothetical protein